MTYIKYYELDTNYAGVVGLPPHNLLWPHATDPAMLRSRTQRSNLGTTLREQTKPSLSTDSRRHRPRGKR